MTLDLLSTITSITGISIPSDRPIDGLDIKSILTGNSTESDSLNRDYFLYRANAIRVGDWKYIKDKVSEQRFNLSTDTEETKNLFDQYTDKVEELI